MREVLLKVEDLHYAYGTGQKALKGINLDIYEGEKIAVLGGNGSGKSTLFLNLNGVLRPDSGDITYKGLRIGSKDLKKMRKHIGIVFQDADHQIIGTTVSSEVSFGPMNMKLSKDDVKRCVADALKYMNLEDLASRPPHYLSGGEKKRVTIADIIAMKSEIMILDEPTAALDPVNIAMLESVLDQLHGEGKTLILSLHDIDFAYRWADRVVVLDEGRVIGDGRPEEILSNKEILNQANLKQPILLELYEGMLKNQSSVMNGEYPKTAKDFLRYMNV